MAQENRFEQLRRREFGRATPTTDQQQSGSEPLERNSGILGDTVDAFQRGAYQGASGLFDFVGADETAETLNQWADEQLQTMSPEGQASMQKEFFNRDSEGELQFGDAASDIRSWWLNLANVTGQLAPTILPGGAAARGLSTVARLGEGGRKVANIGAMGAFGGASAQGQAELQGREIVRNTPVENLIDSDFFVSKLEEVQGKLPDQDLQTQAEVARELVARQVSRDIKTDPKLLAANFVGSAVGDPVIGRVLGKSIGQNILSRFGKGFTAEGVTESIQGGTQQLSTNEAVQRRADPNLDTSEGVIEAALTEGLLGGIVGGGLTAKAPSEMTGNDTIDQAARELDETANQNTTETARAAAAAAVAENRRGGDVAEDGTELRPSQQGRPVELPEGFDIPAASRRAGTSTQQTEQRMQEEPAQPVPGPEQYRPSPVAMRSNGEAYGSEKSVRSSKRFRDAVKEVEESGLPFEVRVVELEDGGYGYQAVPVLEQEAEEQQPTQETRDRGDLDEPAFTRARAQVLADSQDDVDIMEIDRIMAGEPVEGDVITAPEEPRRRAVVGLLPDGRVPISDNVQGELPNRPFIPMGDRTQEFETTEQEGATDAGQPLETARARTQPTQETDQETTQTEEAPAQTARAAEEVTTPPVQRVRQIVDQGLRAERPAVRQRTLDQLSQVFATPKKRQGENETQTRKRFEDLTRRLEELDGMTPQQIEQEYNTVRELREVQKELGLKGNLKKRETAEQIAGWAARTTGMVETIARTNQAETAYRQAREAGQDVPLSIVRQRQEGDRVGGRRTSYPDVYRARDSVLAESLGLESVPAPDSNIDGVDQALFDRVNEVVTDTDSALDGIDPDVLATAYEQAGDVRPDSPMTTGVTPELLDALNLPQEAATAIAPAIRTHFRLNPAPGRQAETTTETDTQTETQPEVTTEPAATTETETTTETQPDVEAETDVEPEAETDVEPEPDTEQTADTDTAAEPEADQNTLNEDDAFQSRSEPQDANAGRPSKPIGRERLNKMAEDFLDQYRGAAKVRIQVRGRPEDGSLTYGGYYPKDGLVVLFADNIPNEAIARRTLRHEILAHHGLRSIIGHDAHSEIMQRLVNSRRSGNKRMQDLWRSVERDYPDVQDDFILAEEVFARAAETETGSLGDAWNRIVAAVKAALRAVGLMDSQQISPEEMRDNLRAIADGLRATRAWNPDGVTDIPDAESTPVSGGFIPQGSQFLRSEPMAGTFESTRVHELEQIMARDRTQAESVVNRMLDGSTLGESVKQAALKVLTLRQVADIFKRKLPQVQGYVDTVQEMLTDRNRRASNASDIASEMTKWAARNKPEANKLADVMHDATMWAADPAKEYRNMRPVLQQRISELEALREAETDAEQIRSMEEQLRTLRQDMANETQRYNRHQQLQQRWAQLTPEAQDFYVRMRDHHAENANEVSNLLYDRVRKSEINSTKKNQMLARIKFEQEAARVKGPYFPLARFGDYYLETKTRDGERYVTSFETRAEFERAVANLKDANLEIVKKGKRTDKDYKEDGASYAFLEDLVANISGLDVTPEQKNRAIDEAYQLYLRHLPDNSIRKNQIHRQGIKGYSNDAVRAFASTSIKNAYQIARLRYQEPLNASMLEMEQQASSDGDPVTADVYNEMKKRHDWVMNPDDSAWARKATAIGFIYMLGVSPAAAAVNLMQTLNVGIPVIASAITNRGGVGSFTSAAFEVMRASKDFIRGKGSIENSITAEEKTALKQWEDSGLIDTTRAHDLMGIAETDGVEYNDRWHRGMELVSKFFHGAEVMNRQVTALAAYRSMRKQGMNPEEASKKAADVTWQSHFDYTNANRAPFMQKGIAKVLFQFKQYSQQMTYYLFRNAYKWTFDKNATAEEKREAGRQLAGTLLTTGALAGLSGMPMTWAAYTVMNSLQAIMGDDEEPWDAETETRNWLVETLGEDVADFMIFGAGGAGLSQRLSLSNLWLNEPYRDLEGKEGWAFYAEQLAGPVMGGIASSFFEGYDLIFRQGQIQRGLEKMVPKFARDLSVAQRYQAEGATNLRGDVLMSADNISGSALLLQSLGLANGDVIKQYEINNAIKGYETEILDERRSLLDGYYQAYLDGDEAEKNNIIARIQRFNRKFPAVSVKAKDLRTSLRSRMRYTQETVDGLRLDQRLRYLAEQTAITRLRGGDDD